MIEELDFLPGADDLLYHYCSPSTLLAILQGKKLRFSDVFSMNDSGEYAWGFKILVDGLRRHGSPFAAEIADFLPWSYDMAHRISITTACCLSTDGDVLSQWRAYAENGAGYSIGFDSKQLKKMDVRALKVLYKPEEQRRLIDEVLLKIEEFKSGVVANPADIPERVVDLLLEMIGFKNPAFDEEKEVRLVRRIVVGTDPHRTFFVTDNGKVEAELSFQMRGSSPSAFQDVPLPTHDCGIRKIVVGPRAQVDARALRILLGASGLGEVSVERSVATYR